MTRKIESVEDDAGRVTRYRRHPNGGGLIGPGAEVDDTSFVSLNTYVEAGAYVGSGCRIGAGSWIDRQARVGDLAFIGDGVYVGERAILGKNVHIGSHSRIGADARIDDGIRLRGDSLVPESGLIEARARLRQKVSANPPLDHEKQSKIAA